MTDCTRRQGVMGERDERGVVRTLPDGNERSPTGHTRLKSVHHQWDLFRPFSVMALDLFRDTGSFAACKR